LVISYVVLTLMNHCSVCEEEPMVAVDLVQACSAFHNDDPLEDAMAYGDASVEEVCDDGDVGDDSKGAVDNRSHRDGNIHYCLFHIHPTDTG
jgi:hypothetical protein